MTPEQVVEATLFASQTPLTPSEIARADGELTSAAVTQAIRNLRESYEAEGRAFQIYELGDGFQVLTRPEFAPYLERFDSVPRSPHLSGAALETLAIVAYRQPIGRIEIEEVRGVGASSVLRTLTDWELIDVVGRGEGLGRPLLYGTTRRFLEHFGFRDLGELPAPEELPVVLAELRPAGEAGTADGTAPEEAPQAAEERPEPEEGPELEGGPEMEGGPELEEELEMEAEDAAAPS